LNFKYPFTITKLNILVTTKWKNFISAFQWDIKNLAKSKRAGVMRSQREEKMRVINYHAALYVPTPSSACAAQKSTGFKTKKRPSAGHTQISLSQLRPALLHLDQPQVLEGVTFLGDLP
jgi:hypothetical protein